MISAHFRLLTAAFLLVCSLTINANELIGRVVGIADGDTLTLLVDGREQYKIRLSGIDAPEKRQAYGQRSKERLADLTFNRIARVEFNKKDRYGRIVGKVTINGRDVNLQIVESGLAWHYKNYLSEQNSTDRLAYGSAEDRARSANLGLWRDKDPVPPWNYRRGVR